MNVLKLFMQKEPGSSFVYKEVEEFTLAGLEASKLSFALKADLSSALASDTAVALLDGIYEKLVLERSLILVVDLSNGAIKEFPPSSPF